MINTRFLVGAPFLDIPQEQLRTIKIPPDPDPVFNARPEPYSMEEGLMPLATEPARTGDPGATIRGENGHYIGVEPVGTGTPPTPPSGGIFKLGTSVLGGKDVLG